MKATVKNKKEIAKGTLLVDFEVPNRPDFKPGQYIFVSLINPPYNDAKGNQRYFSIVNSSNENGITIATRVRDSAFKKSLNELPIGAEVNLGEIDGDFVLPRSEPRSGSTSGVLPTDKSKPTVFIAGGIGITPFISMLRYAKEEKLGYKITLLYSNRDKESAAFLDELQNLEKEISNFKLILTMTDDDNWGNEKRKIDSQFIKDYISEPNFYTYMIAGSPSMVEAMFSVLSETGVDSNNIKTENFSGY